MFNVDAIVRGIGQQPVLAFGNSSRDVAMCEYTVTNNNDKKYETVIVSILRGGNVNENWRE